jgi:hypothetical protein
MYNLICGTGMINFSPEDAFFSVNLSKKVWRWKTKPSIALNDGKVLYFSEAKCESAYCRTGVADGVTAEYSGFTDTEGNQYVIKAYTFTWVNLSTGDVNFEVRVEGDAPGQIKSVSYPAGMELGAETGHGYTVLPRMQGTMVPAGTEIRIADGRIQERDGYMSFYGQVRDGSGYIAVYDTPYDAHYSFKNDVVSPYFITSLGTVRYKRRMTYTFYDKCDYNTFAKKYRSYIQYKGQLITLSQKIAKNPAVARLIGTPVIHEGIAVHISEKSDYYTPGQPEKNDYYTSFATRASQLRELKMRGVEKAYLHLDGWGKQGYDNVHPDVFPPHAAAGGTDGMRLLSDTCRELGYAFGIHDQYRDYYYDGDSFAMSNAIENLDGSHPYCSVWYGGPHSYLCASLAPYYVRRNYDEFERLGIKIEGSYLDVFSVVGHDECHSADHPMTREQCAAARCECLDILTAKGIIPSSEETIDSVVPSLALCHHSPYFTSDLGSPHSEPVGIPIPLFNLVYHDCIVIPWFGAKGQKGGWGIPGCDSAYLHALLNGGTVYYSVNATEAEIEFGKTALDLHRRVAVQELISHEFIGEGNRRQKSVFADGTAVEVDFDSLEWSITADGVKTAGIA